MSGFPIVEGGIAHPMIFSPPPPTHTPHEVLPHLKMKPGGGETQPPHALNACGKPWMFFIFAMYSHNISIFRKKTYVPMLASEYNLCQSYSSSQKSIFAENNLKL